MCSSGDAAAKRTTSGGGVYAVGGVDMDRGVVADPYPYLEGLQAQCPVVREPHHGVWMVTGWEEASEVAGGAANNAQGYAAMFASLEAMLCEVTGFAAVSLQPNSGAQGEYAGLVAIARYHASRGEAHRNVCLIPKSAHGTNPATAAACGFEVESIPADATGRVDLAALKAKLGPDVAGIMLTNPNTCGLFERDIVEIAKAVHDVGGYFYCDGANYNAIVGRVRPGDLGIDCMHINLHKTFTTPHGGGGPGCGPVGVVEKLVVYPENMLKNMNKFKGLVMSQRVLLALTQAGVSREDSYRLVQRNAMKVWESDGQLSLLELLKADAVLVNTAIAVSGDPVAMGRAFALACEAGRSAYKAGLGARGSQAQASSPLTDFLGAL